MTAISFNTKESSTLSNLVLDGNTAATGISLSWESSVSAELWSTEVWVSETNDRSTAALVDTVTTNNFLYIGTPNTVYYFWIRAVSIYDKPSTNWLPIDPFAGKSGVINRIVAKDLSPNATSLHSFGATDIAVPGIGGVNYQSVVTFSITNDSDTLLPFSFTHSCLQQYSAGAKDTKWIIRDATLNATIFDWGTFITEEHLPTLSAVYSIPAGSTRVIILYWWAEDNTVSITNRAFNFLALKELG